MRVPSRDRRLAGKRHGKDVAQASLDIGHRTAQMDVEQDHADGSPGED